MTRKLKIFFILMFMSTTVSYGLGNVEAGKVKAQACAVCHQPDGNSINPMYPKLAGQNEGYLLKQLHDYQKGSNGSRNNPIMYGMVANLSAQDIEDISAYFSAQKPSFGKTEVKYLELGRKIYQGGLLDKGIAACSGCHSPNGMGNEQARFPMLSGQYADYIITQMHAFKTGQRHNSPNDIMTTIAQKMSDEEIQAVAHFTEGLH